MDKMTIVGKDGKLRYEVIGERVQDLRKCTCAEPESVDTQISGSVRQNVVGCKKCGGLILLTTTPSEEI